jgi:hypothetical protein
VAPADDGGGEPTGVPVSVAQAAERQRHASLGASGRGPRRWLHTAANALDVPAMGIGGDCS